MDFITFLKSRREQLGYSQNKFSKLVNITQSYFNSIERGEAKKHDVELAILKEGSPSCGVNKIHNGEFKGIKKVGKGVTAALFEMNGIRAISEKDLEQKRQK